MQDAHHATRIAYSTIHAHAKAGDPVSRHTANRLQEWSYAATGGEVWISAAIAAGIADAPTTAVA